MPQLAGKVKASCRNLLACSVDLVFTSASMLQMESLLH
jgi:hypothetical protein